MMDERWYMGRPCHARPCRDGSCATVRKQCLRMDDSQRRSGPKAAELAWSVATRRT